MIPTLSIADVTGSSTKPAIMAREYTDPLVVPILYLSSISPATAGVLCFIPVTTPDDGIVPDFGDSLPVGPPACLCPPVLGTRFSSHDQCRPGVPRTTHFVVPSGTVGCVNVNLGNTPLFNSLPSSALHIPMRIIAVLQSVVE